MRLVRVTVPSAAPTAGVEPHITLSRLGSAGRPVSGFRMALVQGSGSGWAVADAGGFVVRTHRLGRVLGQWADCGALSLAYSEDAVSDELGAGEALYFEIGNVATPGDVLISIGEREG